MRIVGGRFRGRRLITPRDRSIRPTSDRAREALFGMLEHGEPPLRGARFLDLFAGTGAVGLEACSRGAAEVVLVENAAGALALIKANVAALGQPPGVKRMAVDAARLGPAPGRFDIVFVDPPYGSGLGTSALEALARGWLADDARVVVELAAREDLDVPVGYEIEGQRRYGAAKLVLLRRIGYDPGPRAGARA